MTSQLRSAAIVCLVAGGLAGCESSVDTVGIGQQPQVRDSAGVLIVQLPAEFDLALVHRADLRKVAQLGAEGSGTELFRVSSARILPTGDVAVGNSGTAEILIFTPEGALDDRLGGRGGGPGEFGRLTSLHVPEDGSLVAYDDALARLTVFDPSGDILGTRGVAGASSTADLLPLVASLAGPILAIFGDNRRFELDGVRRDTTPLLRFSVESLEPDTLGYWASKVWSFQSTGGRVSRTELAFGPDLLSAGRGSFAALAETHRPLVRVLDEHGNLLMRVEWNAEPRPVTDAEYEAWQQEQFSLLGDDLPEAIRSRLASVPRYGTHPVILDISVGSDGGVWVAPAASGGRTWIRFGPDGSFLGSLLIPQEGRLLDHDGNRLAVLERDGLGIETVVVYEALIPDRP